MTFGPMYGGANVALVTHVDAQRDRCRTVQDHHHLFAQNTIKIDNGDVNEQDRKAHCALTSAHNITSTVERNTHSTIHGIGVTRNR